MSNLIAFGTAALVFLLVQLASPAEAISQELGQQRLDSMRKTIEQMEIVSLSTDEEIRNSIKRTPILRFGDATRQASDAALWKFGENRPKILVALEFTEIDGRTQLCHEFLSLTEEPFTLTTPQGWRWVPSGSGLKFQELKGLTKPNASSAVRLRQIKAASRRFTASEFYEGETFTLRLMPQPIDRYRIGANDEGAIFAFVNGTNPEVLLFIESNGEGWKYGLSRLCGAEPTVKLDGQTVWTLPSMEELGKSWRLSYTGDAFVVED